MFQSHPSPRWEFPANTISAHPCVPPMPLNSPGLDSPIVAMLPAVLKDSNCLHLASLAADEAARLPSAHGRLLDQPGIEAWKELRANCCLVAAGVCCVMAWLRFLSLRGLWVFC